MKQDNKNKELSIITYDMSDKDRASYLKTKSIKVVVNDSSRFELTEEQLEVLKEDKIKNIKRELKNLGIELGVFKEYKNIGDTDINAYFSIRNLYESITKSTTITGMYYIIYNIDSIIANSIKIEEHIDNKMDRNVESTNELISILNYSRNNYMLIKATIKKISSINQHNIIYSLSNFETIELIKKKGDAAHQMFELNQALDTLHPLSKIMLTNLLSYVNSPDILRYIPNELLNNAQIQIKKEAIDKYNEIKRKQIERKQNTICGNHKELSKITYDMSDKDRADYLKNKNISVVINDETKFNDVDKLSY